MPLTSPNLDDRDFYQLLAEARQHIQQTCPDWSDLSPSDPGWTLVELFAHLTETMIYRLNRLPEKAYIEFLRLMGVSLNPPTAAQAELHFTLNQPATTEVTIPRGIRVTTGRSSGDRTESPSGPPIFVTAQTAKIQPGQQAATVMAYHAEWIAAEQAGTGTGQPGMVIFAQRPPLVAKGGAGSGLSLYVGVEATAAELSDRDPALQYNGKAYRLWREVETFANLAGDRRCYQVDRVTGQINLAPAIQLTEQARLQAPPPEREIRLWYYRGGGPEGNIAAHQLTVLKDPLPGVTVTNPQAASGGRAAESLEAALVRGPLELHALDRAVTASDFELHTLNSSGAVSRAKAMTQAELWQHGTPGTVDILLVPQVTSTALTNQRTAAQYQAQETEDTRQHIQQALEERRPLGTRCQVNWVRYKTVQVKARLVVHRGEDAAAVQQRVLQRLYRTISPQTWEFGQPLRVDRVYGIVLKEPGVSHVENIRFQVDDVPNQQVQVLTADASQPHTWYSGAGGTLFRSLNDGDSWEAIRHFESEIVKRVASHPRRPGLIAVITQLPDDGGDGGATPSEYRIYFSFDCGETWQPAGQLSFTIHDIAWISRAGNASNLLMATSKGLYAQLARPGANPVPLSVDEGNADLGFYAVAVAVDARGTVSVAVAAEAGEGVYLSHQEGRPGSFRRCGLQDVDIRTLAVQQDGPRSFLWAGAYVAGNEAGQGCFQWELPESPNGWVPFNRGWVGGSCRAIACQSSEVYAASFSAGVLTLNASSSAAAWQAPVVQCGLPVRDTERTFFPINTLDIRPDAEQGERGEPTLLAGGELGVYRSHDRAQQYVPVSNTEFTEKVMLPPTWLFCSGTHEIEVISP